MHVGFVITSIVLAMIAYILGYRKGVDISAITIKRILSQQFKEINNQLTCLENILDNIKNNPKGE